MSVQDKLSALSISVLKGQPGLYEYYDEGLCRGTADNWPIQQYMEDPDNTVLVALSPNKSVDGVCVFGENVILLLCTRVPGTGLGTRLLQKASSLMDARGIDTMYLDPAADAEPFYTKLGFNWCDEDYMCAPVPLVH